MQKEYGLSLPWPIIVKFAKTYVISEQANAHGWTIPIITATLHSMKLKSAVHQNAQI